MDGLFSDAAGRLATHPKMGKPGKIAGTRELIPHESYKLAYEIEEDTVWVLALVHTARLWPPARCGRPSICSPLKTVAKTTR